MSSKLIGHKVIAKAMLEPGTKIKIKTWKDCYVFFDGSEWKCEENEPWDAGEIDLSKAEEWEELEIEE